MAYDSNIECRKAGCNSHDVELHHIIPKCIGGSDKDGRKYLCEKHHKILGLMIPRFIWKYVPDNLKEACKRRNKTQNEKLY